MDLEVKAMSKILVKAYIPTIDEKRGISLDDIIDGGSLRYVRPGERNIGMDARNLSRHQRTARGANIPYEIEVARTLGADKTIPGLLDLDNPTQINPNFNVTGTFVGPPNQGFLRRPDMSFRRDSPAVLLGSTQNPEWWRTAQEGSLTPAEGYKYGGFDKDTVVEIPLPKNTTPQHLVYPGFGMEENLTQEELDFLSQFPDKVGSFQWRQKAGPRMDINQLIASGKLQPLSLDQRIQPHESPFLEDDVTRKVASEPMDIANQLLKYDDEIPDYSDYPVYQCEVCDKYLDESSYYLLNDHHYCKDHYFELLDGQEFDPDFQSKLTGEPMDLAFRLLKRQQS